VDVEFVQMAAVAAVAAVWFAADSWVARSGERDVRFGPEAEPGHPNDQADPYTGERWKSGIPGYEDPRSAGAQR
jgi:hypothetical protein